MLRRFEFILLFYKPFFWWSFGVTILILFISSQIFVAITTKFFLTALVMFIKNEISSKERWVFLEELGISKIELFVAIYLIDLPFTVSLILILKEFI